MAKRKGLGRGLDALLGTSPPSQPPAEDATTSGELRDLPIERLRRGAYQPRLEMDADALEELASSIRARGVVQPIVVRPVEGGAYYEIVVGERRWRASQLAGLDTIPALVRDLPDSAAIAVALIENIQREDLNPLEEAQALRRLIDEFDMTHQSAADAVGRSRAAVSNLLRLLDLNPDVKELLLRGELEMGHARALLALNGATQSQVAREVVTKGLTARETERLVTRNTAERPARRASAREDPNVRRLEEQLSERLAAPVQVQHGARGKGRLVIQYTSLDELDGIIARIGSD